MRSERLRDTSSHLEILLTEVRQHGSDVRHVFNDIVRDVTNPLGQRIQIDGFDDLGEIKYKI